MSETAKLLNQIKEDSSVIDKILYPGEKLSKFDRNNLRIHTLPSGFNSLDEKKVLKQGRGELILIGARPGLGKSAFGFQIATNIAKRDKVHVFSLEMSHESVAARQMALIMDMSLSIIQAGGAETHQGELAQQEMATYDFVIDDRADLNVHQICDAARMQNKKSRTGLIVIDYLQLIKTPKDGKRGTRAEDVANISAELRTLAKELRIPVLALCQLNRQSEFREGGRPQLSDLKESGSLEQDADVVLLIHRPETAPEDAVIIIAKNRNGPVGDIRMQFASARCMFIDKGFIKESENELG